MRKYRKSIVGATAIVVGVAVFVFVITIVLTFFYFFKFQITLVMWEQYSWNKFQEVPLSLLSMDLDGESFVSKMNKVYYNSEDQGQLSDRIDDIIKKQISPTGTATASVDIKIAGIKITREIPCTSSIPGCSIVEEDKYLDITKYVCSCLDECPSGGKILGEVERGFPPHEYHCTDYYTVCDCAPDVQPKIYSAKFPFPLTFNGTDKFVDNISYDAIVTESG